MATDGKRVNVVTLGCARNEVDSEELAGRLREAGWALETDASLADVVLVNTCGFIESAKKDSIDTLIAHADGERAVVAVGCLAERYGVELAAALPEATAVLGFDAYTRIGEVLDDVVAGVAVESHPPIDRRTLIPVTPIERPRASSGWRPPVLRERLDGRPVAPLKLASGCDRRCSFCAIPRFRGAFVSRPPEEILDEASWLATQGVREINLVSENSTSYGKDLGDIRLLESLLPRLGQVAEGVRVRVAYLQPAEMRASLIDVIARHPSIAPYFDLSFQHASPGILRRMRRFGGTSEFLDLLAQIRSIAPHAGVRSNVIVGFPGETRDDVDCLIDFLERARLDAVGVFGYSDEDDTEAQGFADKVDPHEVGRRVAEISTVSEELMAQRALERTGETVDVLVESIESSGESWRVEGRAGHQGPDDGSTYVDGAGAPPQVGDRLRVTVTSANGVDLLGRVAT